MSISEIDPVFAWTKVADFIQARAITVFEVIPPTKLGKLDMRLNYYLAYPYHHVTSSNWVPNKDTPWECHHVIH